MAAERLLQPPRTARKRCESSARSEPKASEGWAPGKGGCERSARSEPQASERRKRGFTLLELVIVVCLIGLLAALAARRLLVLRVEAERAALSQVLGGLQAAVALEVLSRISEGRDAELAEVSGANPMHFLVDPPWTYLGEFDAADPARITPGRWYFDRGEGLLVYRVRYAERFHSELQGPARARFRVELVWDDRDGDGRFDAGLDRLGGARLQPVEPYGWLPHETGASQG